MLYQEKGNRVKGGIRKTILETKKVEIKKRGGKRTNEQREGMKRKSERMIITQRLKKKEKMKE